MVGKIFLFVVGWGVLAYSRSKDNSLAQDYRIAHQGEAEKTVV